MTVAVYAGMFDPVTKGHVDIATRASRLFDKIIISILEDPTGERFYFNTAERVAMVKEAIKNISNVEVRSFSGMVTDYAGSVGAQILIRGLRMSSDFELEFERALSNKELYPALETVCLMTCLEYQYLTARGLKEVVSLGGNIDIMVPENVAKALKKKLLVKKMTF
jgi:pantetheine-phosphate adenylyltransferase